MKQFSCSDTVKMLSIFLTAGFLFGSCKHKTNFEELTEVSYAASISPIISSNCAFSGCHGDSAFQKMSLTTYDALINGGIKAGDPANSKLYKSLKSLDDDIMPKRPYNELTEKQIQLIYVWIGQGAKNN
jgi:hypothetical protein